MEDHVGGLLRALLALLAALGSVASLLLASARRDGSAESLAALAALAGLLAIAFGAHGRPRTVPRDPRRAGPGPDAIGPVRGSGRVAGAVTVAASVLGATVLALVLGQMALVVGRAFLAGGPSLAL